MMRDPPWLDPLSCAGVNFSSPSTRCPLAARWYGGGAAHPAQTDDDDVVTHSSYLLIRAISGSTTGSACTVAANRVPR